MFGIAHKIHVFTSHLIVLGYKLLSQCKIIRRKYALPLQLLYKDKSFRLLVDVGVVPSFTNTFFFFPLQILIYLIHIFFLFLKYLQYCGVEGRTLQENI